MEAIVRRYLASLPDELRMLVSRYRVVDLAQKVVGVGSVGTRCAVVLALGGAEGDDPLFMQIKEASASVLEPYLGASPYPNHGQRVVVGQRLMQAASDIFLGWSTIDGRDYYSRQLRDMKLSAEIETMHPKVFSSMSGYAERPWRGRTRGRVIRQRSAVTWGVGICSTRPSPHSPKPMRTRPNATMRALLAAIKEGRVQAQTGV